MKSFNILICMLGICLLTFLSCKKAISEKDCGCDSNTRTTQFISYNTADGEINKFEISLNTVYVKTDEIDSNKYQILFKEKSFALINLHIKDTSDFNIKKRSLLKDFKRVEPVLIYTDGTKQIYFGEVIVKLKDPEDLDRLFKPYKYRYRKDEFVKNQFILELDSIDTYQVFDLINQIQDKKEIDFIEPNFIKLLKSTTNDTYYTSQ